MTPYEIAEKWFVKLRRVVGEGKTTRELARVYFGHDPSDPEVVFARSILIELEKEGRMKPLYHAGQEIWIITE